MNRHTGADDDSSGARASNVAVPPVALQAATLPTALQQLADAIAVVQQRIDHLELSDDMAAQLSREVRRAVRAVRVDVVRGRRELDRLHRRLDALDALDAPEG